MVLSYAEVLSLSPPTRLASPQALLLHALSLGGKWQDTDNPCPELSGVKRPHLSAHQKGPHPPAHLKPF